jgi:hypothetical protein
MITVRTAHCPIYLGMCAISKMVSSLSRALVIASFRLIYLLPYWTGRYCTGPDRLVITLTVEAVVGFAVVDWWWIWRLFHSLSLTATLLPGYYFCYYYTSCFGGYMRWWWW